MPSDPGNLVPSFPSIERPRGKGTRSSPILDDPDKIVLFAQSVADGQSIKQLAELFHISERTVSTYKRDPRVKAIALKLTEDRVFRITRKVDSEIETRLADADEMDTDTLLKVRKEFLGGVLRLQTTGGKADAKTINEAMDEIENNPEFAAELESLLERHSAKE